MSKVHPMLISLLDLDAVFLNCLILYIKVSTIHCVSLYAMITFIDQNSTLIVNHINQSTLMHRKRCMHIYKLNPKYNKRFCNGIKSFLKEHSYLFSFVQVNLCQKLLFLQNTGRTCCVHSLF